jgi:hypothetical protein
MMTANSQHYGSAIPWRREGSKFSARLSEQLKTYYDDDDDDDDDDDGDGDDGDSLHGREQHVRVPAANGQCSVLVPDHRILHNCISFLSSDGTRCDARCRV